MQEVMHQDDVRKPWWLEFEPMQIRTIIFDWSGTLIDDLPAVLKATNHVFRMAGMAEWTLEQFRAEFCLPFKKFYDRFTPGLSMAQLEEWFHTEFKLAQDLVGELPHAREFLAMCQKAGVEILVLTTVRDDHFWAQARGIGFDEFIDHAYTGVHDKCVKIVELLEERGLNPEETLFVGDMQHDIEAARHGGVHSCGVLTGYNGLLQLRAAKPDLIVEHLGELSARLADGKGGLELAQGEATRSSAKSIPVVTVGALIFNRAGEVLMVRTHKWSDRWGIPGGKMKWGETAEDALRREIKEETALDVADIEFVMVQDCVRPPEFYREAHFVLLNYRCRCVGAEKVNLNAEAQEYRWASIQQAFELPLNEPTRTLLAKVVANADSTSGVQSNG